METNKAGEVTFYLPSSTSTAPLSITKQQLGKQFVIPGEIITSEAGYLRGHGTYEKEEGLVASVSGLVERTGKLISVKPLKSRYTGEVGDVVVGRVVEVQQKQWRVNANSKQDALLSLSAIHLPGGVLRRRTTSDELQMRNFFVENDVISCEVQQIKQDGSLALHTRSTKYGKLTNGILVSVPPVLIKRVKNHFYSFAQFNVDVILGLNGNIWISQAESEEQRKKRDEAMEQDESFSEELFHTEISPKTRERISRLRNCILALASQFLPIYPDTISETFETSIELKIQSKDILKPDNIDQLTEKSKARIHNL